MKKCVWEKTISQFQTRLEVVVYSQSFFLRLLNETWTFFSRCFLKVALKCVQYVKTWLLTLTILLKHLPSRSAPGLSKNIPNHNRRDQMSPSVSWKQGQKLLNCSIMNLTFMLSDWTRVTHLVLEISRGYLNAEKIKMSRT